MCLKKGIPEIWKKVFWKENMKISIIAVGKLGEKYLKEGVLDYQKRIGKYCNFDIIEIKDEKNPNNASDEETQQIKEAEALRIKKKIKKGSTVFVLDIIGNKISSEELAQKLNSLFLEGKTDITFIIGGSLGVYDELIKEADDTISLSDMTFPHRLTRLILVEQIYRAFKIIKKEPYHK